MVLSGPGWVSGISYLGDHLIIFLPDPAPHFCRHLPLHCVPTMDDHQSNFCCRQNSFIIGPIPIQEMALFSGSRHLSPNPRTTHPAEMIFEDSFVIGIGSQSCRIIFRVTPKANAICPPREMISWCSGLGLRQVLLNTNSLSLQSFN